MKDLTNRKLIYAKAFLFVVTGATAAALLLAHSPSMATAALLAIAIWSFSRAYYFAFYVVEHYVDRSFNFSGLFSVARFLWRNRRA